MMAGPRRTVLSTSARASSGVSMKPWPRSNETGAPAGDALVRGAVDPGAVEAQALLAHPDRRQAEVGEFDRLAGIVAVGLDSEWPGPFSTSAPDRVWQSRGPRRRWLQCRVPGPRRTHLAGRRCAVPVRWTWISSRAGPGKPAGHRADTRWRSVVRGIRRIAALASGSADTCPCRLEHDEPLGGHGIRHCARDL